MEVSIYSVIFSKVMALAGEGKLVNYSKKRWIPFTMLYWSKRKIQN